VWTWVGTVISVISLAMAIYFVGRTAIVGADVPGFASLIVSITFLAGIQLLSLGILGEYIGRIFAEVKGRPLYIVERRIGLSGTSLEAQAARYGTGHRMTAGPHP
jgi:polyisoprenyl-phosphate glycosyltransferase